jgi:uncharacterized membrane protein YbhN (UPF0104 family)
LLSYAIYRQISHRLHWKDSLQEIRQAISGPQQWKIWATLLLMTVNWGLEAKKWQLTNRMLQSLTFWQSFKAVLTGTAIAAFTPNRVGEYFGRMLYIEEGKRARSIALTIVGSLAQFAVTLVCGIAGILYLEWHLHHHTNVSHAFQQASLNLLLLIISGGLVLLLIFYFRLPGMVRKIAKWGKFTQYVKILMDLPLKVLLQILCLSFARYTVFIVQYGLLFSVFSVELSFAQLFGGISVMYLVMAVVPTFTFLTDLGLRWEAGIKIMELFSNNMVGVLAASLGIWLINLIIPALIGSLLILSIKVFRIQ